MSTIEELEDRVEYLENQLQIRGNMLKATENKVEELYERLEEKDKVIDACSKAGFELERTHIELTDQLKLAMLAGAYAIRNNQDLKAGCFAHRRLQQTISWSDAEKWLICAAQELDPYKHEIIHE